VTILQAVFSIAAVAALFALFGLVRYRGCTGHCAGCTRACGRFEGEDDEIP